MILCAVIRIDYLILRESIHKDRYPFTDGSDYYIYDHNDHNRNDFIEEIINESLYFPMGYG